MNLAIWVGMLEEPVFRKLCPSGLYFNTDADRCDWPVNVHNCVNGKQLAEIGSTGDDQSGKSPKVVALFLLQTLVALWYDYFNSMIQSKRSHILVPNLVAFMSQNEKNVWFFDYHLLTCSVRKMVLLCLMQNIDMYLLYKSHQIARLVSRLINHFCKWMFTV